MQDQVHSVKIERDNRVLEQFQTHGRVKQSIGLVHARRREVHFGIRAPKRQSMKTFPFAGATFMFTPP
jgi:hypothetical protein